jgi:hypothetical protein
LPFAFIQAALSAGLAGAWANAAFVDRRQTAINEYQYFAFATDLIL